MSHAIVEHPASDGSPPLSNQPAPAKTRSWGMAALVWAGRSVPTVLVLALLAGVGYYGHRWDWKLPKFQTLAGAKPAEPDDWCEEHGVPESQCIACNPKLMPPGPDYGWCSEHGVANCPLHHPDVAQLKHKPSISEADFKRAARALAVADRKQNNAVCRLYQTRIQFASLEAVRQAGVDVELVDRQPIVEAVAGNGEITYDPTRLASLSSRVPGTVWRVEKNIGDKVQTGDVLALIDAVAVGQTKTQLMQALAEEQLQQQNATRLKEVGGVVAGRQVLEAEAALAKARAAVLAAEQSLINLGLPADVEAWRGLSEREVLKKLRFLGLPENIRAHLDEKMATTNLIPVVSPMDGEIMDRQVVAGQVVDASRVLFQVGDTRSMWLILNVPLEKAGKLSLGQRVRFHPDGSEREVSGMLDWISSAADQKTRMVQVRAELDNPDGQLRNETFGTGQIILREEKDAIVVPNQAVHWEGCCQIVFVRDKNYFDGPHESPKIFHVRTVRLGVKTEKYTEVIAGVLPGEVVAVKGSDVLQAQLLKNNLGAGCGCADD